MSISHPKPSAEGGILEQLLANQEQFAARQEQLTNHQEKISSRLDDVIETVNRNTQKPLLKWDFRS